MTIPDYRDHIQRLTEGINSRAALDNPSLSLKQIFVEVVLAFNNDEIIIDLPDGALDLEHIDLLDANDQSRIRIQRDRKWKLPLIILLDYYLTLYSIIYFTLKSQTFGRNIYGTQP